MMNELIFIVHACIVSICALGALALGKAALTTFISIMCILANLFVLKQIILCGFNATTSDALSIGATIGLNLMLEYYGRAAAQRAIGISFASILVYTVLSYMHLLYIPSACDVSNTHFIALLAIMPRILLASCTVYVIVQALDYHLYTFLNYALKNRYFIMRNYISVIICQLLDTILFSFLGLYGIIDNIWHVIMVSYTIKVILIILATPFLWFTKKIVPTAKYHS
jgi:queuosine precursor transporter